MSRSIYLTKSRFKLGLECLRKLSYVDRAEYANSKKDDGFLGYLAEGGFQVEALAKLYYPEGIDLRFYSTEESAKKTRELLKQKEATLFEATTIHNNLLVRADILQKKGDKLFLREVKAKSVHTDSDSAFFSASGKLNLSDWEGYLFDIAFQVYVIGLAYPDFEIEPSLVLVNKSAVATADGMNQRLRIIRDDNSKIRIIQKGSFTKKELAQNLLADIPVDRIVPGILNSTIKARTQTCSFDELVKKMVSCYTDEMHCAPPIGSKCGNCEYTCTQEESEKKMKSGLMECWKEAAGFSRKDFNSPLVLDLWRGGKKIDSLIAQEKYFLEKLNDTDIASKSGKQESVTAIKHQVQVTLAKTPGRHEDIDLDGLRKEFAGFAWPLHFIDFETAMPAIPFHKGMHPYEGIAFQFSHHTVTKDGTIRHAGQYLCDEPGKFPNFKFVRELKSQLAQDNGSIFRFAPHENTYLNFIYNQLENSSRSNTGIPIAPDAAGLMDFIVSITEPSKENAGKWDTGPRCMIDLCEMARNHYYHYMMRGSYSLKDLLPAILNESTYLQKFYKKPIYGKHGQVKSLNFESVAWILKDCCCVRNPYALLKELVSIGAGKNADEEDVDIHEGGAASAAYARLQFEDLPENKHQAIRHGLLCYCELDTLAMVMLWQYWQSLLTRPHAKKRA